MIYFLDNSHLLHAILLCNLIILFLLNARLKCCISCDYFSVIFYKRRLHCIFLFLVAFTAFFKDIKDISTTFAFVLVAWAVSCLLQWQWKIGLLPSCLRFSDTTYHQLPALTFKAYIFWDFICAVMSDSTKGDEIPDSGDHS